MRLSRFRHAFLAMAFLVPTVVHAQAARESVGGGLSFRTTTFNNGLGFGARAMGMAGAFPAIADDASAASWNPAGLGQLIRPEVTIVGGYNEADIGTKNETATYYDTTTGKARLYLNSNDRSVDAKSYGIDFASFVQPFKLGRQLFTTQISYARNARPLDGTESLRIDFTDAQGRDLAPDFYDTKITSTGGWDSFGIGLGTGFDDKLYIGFSLNYFTGNASTATETRFQSYEYDSHGNKRLFADYTTQSYDDQVYSGLSANVGVLIKPSPKFSIGIVYRGGWGGGDAYQTRFDQRGSYTFNVTAPDGTTTRQYLPFQAVGQFTSNGTLTWPSTLGGGVAWRPVEAFTVALDMSQTQWARSTITRVPVASTGSCSLSNGSVTCPVNWSEHAVNFPSESTIEQNNQLAYRLGLEYVLRPGSLVIPIRAGAYRIRTIAPIYGTGDTDPSAVFGGFTAGAGIAIPVGESSLLFDMAAVFDKADTSRDAAFKDSDGNVTSTVGGDRTVKNRRFIGSLIYRF